jgi:PAS domain S-box-containing protein
VSLSVRLYVAATVVLAAGLVLLVAVVEKGGLFDRPWLIAAFGALIALEHLFEGRLVREGEQGESYSYEESFLVAMALLASPFAVTLAFAAGFVSGQLIVRRAPIKALFNVAAMVASAAVALLVVVAADAERATSPEAVAAVLVAAAVFILVNRTLLSGVFTVAGAGSFRENFFDDFAARMLVSTGAVAVGLLTGLAAAEHLWTLPFGLAATVALHFAFSGHTRARADEQKLADIVGSSSDGILTVSPRGRVLSWNPACERITGRRASEAVGRELEDVFALLEAEPEGRAEEHGVPDLLRIRTAAGETRWLAVTRSPLPEGGSVIVLRDETTRRQFDAMVAREESERLKSDLVAAVSHELRTPLTSILGFTQTLLRGGGRDEPEEPRRRYLEIIEKESGRLRDLIDDLLDLRQIAEGRFAVDQVRIDVGALVSEQIELFAGQSEAHRLVPELPGEPLWVRGDRDRLSQVVSNLISNAIKYSPEGGEVRVSAATDNGRVRVSIRDEGLGIALDQHPLVFSRFYRSESSRRRGIAGTGLGLALSREIVEAHAGRIGFDSREGGGSTFYFELPAA